MGIAVKFLKKHTEKIDKKYLLPVPFFFTFANAVMGLASVIYALEKDITVAAYCIIAAAFFDMLDGKIARALGVESMIGVALDSLCDAVSFCFAPVVLLYSWQLHNSAAGKFIAAFYLCAGLYRLAKFNVVGYCDQSVFIGLPTTAAATFLSNLVLYQSFVYGPWYVKISSVIISVMIVVVSLLMVSSIKFSSFKTKMRNITFSYLRAALAVGLFVGTFWYHYPLLLIAFVVYVLFYFFKTLYCNAMGY